MNKEDRTFFEFKVDVKSALPVYEQVKRAIKLAILSGRLQDGEKLMSLRELALKLQINPNTIIKIYTQLEVEGYIYSRPGSGYFVQYDKEKIKKERYELFEEETQDYISKVIALGYSIGDILEIMKRYFNRNHLSGSDANTGNRGGSNDKD
ncbi:MAG: GntR family transcriptional regulator [Candidatus Aminicenantes bacterium]|jgi:GntR family transcriptional regulator